MTIWRRRSPLSAGFCKVLNLHPSRYFSAQPEISNTKKVHTVDNQDVNSNEKVFDQPVGITNPPIDELLTKVSSKYALVIFAAKRARQINDYFQTLDDGVFEFVGPLVTPDVHEKPLSIALREINRDLLEHTEG